METITVNMLQEPGTADCLGKPGIMEALLPPEGHRHHWHIGETGKGLCDCGETKQFAEKLVYHSQGQVEPEQDLTWQDYWAIADRVSRGTLESDDVAQEAFIAQFQAKPRSRALARTIAWRARADYWKWLKYRLNGKVSTAKELREGLTVADTLGDNGQGPVVAGLLSCMPKAVLAIGLKKMNGLALSRKEQKQLERFRQAWA